MHGPAVCEAREEPRNETRTDESEIQAIVQTSEVEKIDFYPKDNILRVQAQNQDPLEELVDESSLRTVLAIARNKGITHKFASHFNESLISTEDDDWVFLQEQLVPCFAQMRLHFRGAYEEHQQSDAAESAGFSKSRIAANRHQAAASLVNESFAAIMSSLKSAGAVKMFKRYQARVQVPLRRHVEEVFSSLEAAELSQ